MTLRAAFLTALPTPTRPAEPRPRPTHGETRRAEARPARLRVVGAGVLAGLVGVLLAGVVAGVPARVPGIGLAGVPAGGIGGAPGDVRTGVPAVLGAAPGARPPEPAAVRGMARSLVRAEVFPTAVVTRLAAGADLPSRRFGAAGASRPSAHDEAARVPGRERYDRRMLFQFADFEVDEEAFELRRDDEPVSIAPLPLKLLLHLLERHPAVPSKDELMETLWPGTIVSEASLSQAVRAVRVALGEGARADGVVRTVRGRGFGIGVPVRKKSADEPTTLEVQRDPLLGRDDEMARGRQQLAHALRGEPQVLILLGEPGIGKTRLADELAAEARTAGARVLLGRSLEGDQEPAFWPWVQILRSQAAVSQPAALAALLGEGAADIAAVVPEIAKRLTAGNIPVEPRQAFEPDQQRFAFFDAVAGFFAALTRETPLLLVLDDLHWADEASLLLLEYLAQEMPASRLFIVATCRDAGLTGDAGLQQTLAALARGRHETETITLDGLDRAAIGSLIAAQTGREPPADLLDTVYERSEGNPLFARELSRWIEREAADAGEVPVGIQQVIRQRLRALPDETRRVLGTASLVGREFSVALLARACEAKPVDVLAAIEPAENAGIVEPVGGGSGTMRFAHALVRETLETGLSTRERAALHLAVATALESMHAAQPERILSELATHFAAALPVGEPAKALDYALRAAETDIRLLAFERAIRNAQLALRIVDESGSEMEDARGSALRLLADARFHAGDRAAAATTWWEMVDAARRTHDAPALADAAMSLTLANVFTAHSHQETVALLREALDELGAEDSPRRARLLSWLARQVTWTEEAERQDELTREAVAMARRIDDGETLLDVLGARGSILEHGGADEEREATYQELLKLARESSSRIFEADALTLRLQHRIELGDAGGIDNDLAVLERLGAELHHPFYQAFAARAAAMRALWRGELPEAEAAIQHAFKLGEQVDAEHARVVLAAQLTALRRLQGRGAELEAGARDAADQYPMMASFRCALAALQLEAGHVVDARATFERLAEGGFAEIRPDRPNHALNLALLAETAAALGDVARAACLEEKLLPLERRLLTAPNAVSAGCSSRHLGALAALRGERELAERRFAEAIDVERRLGANAWLVAALLDRARARGAFGQRAEALADLDEATELAEARSLEGPLAAAQLLRKSLAARRKATGKRA